jgi:hypothetical protein
VAKLNIKLSQKCYIQSMKWDIKYHDEKLQADVLALPPGILARYFHCTDRMMEFSPDLGMPHTPPKELALARKRMKEWKHADT